jgi:prepilin-type N-terminal cleavage/methylation domain-containing protein
MRLRRQVWPRGDGGFTLVELLITIVILGVIAVPLSQVVLSYFVSTATTTARLTESHDEQIAAAYWQQDVASIGVRAAYDPSSQTFALQQSVNRAFPCALPSPSSAVVTLAWNAYDSSGTATLVSVAYVTQATATQLVRVQCTGSTVDSTAVLTHDLAAQPTVTCTGGGVTSCADATGKVPTSISMALSVSDPSGKGQPYTVTLTGQRRQT